MTEEEWLSAMDPKPMLEFLRGKASDRKLRLFAVGCCRRIWDWLTDEKSRRAVAVMERHADAKAGGYEDLRSVNRVVAAWDAAGADWTQALAEPGRWATECSAWAAMTKPQQQDTERTEQAALLRCTFGTPWHPITVAPDVLAWQSGTVVRMAEVIYNERRWDSMPLLGDALEDAGCGDQAVLDHCRGSGPHARGCFVVDAILDRS